MGLDISPGGQFTVLIWDRSQFFIVRTVGFTFTVYRVAAFAALEKL